MLSPPTPTTRLPSPSHFPNPHPPPRARPRAAFARMRAQELTISKFPSDLRVWSDKLVATASLHFLAALPPLLYLHASAGASAYAGLVLASTFASILWHRAREPPGWAAATDLLLAGLWGCADLVVALGEPNPLVFAAVATANAACALAHRAVEQVQRNNSQDQGFDSYDHWHSVWHVFSAVRAAAVASCLWPLRVDI